MENRVQKICKDCNKPFSITQGELDWLEQKGFKPFERCHECRSKRRIQAKAAVEVTYGKQKTI